MKRPDRFPSDDAREWLNRARSNLARARAVTAEAYLEDYCFDAQQAAEKAIKAVMLKRGIDFPYIHDIARLLRILESDGQAVPESLERAADLTRYATSMRYPGADEPVSAEAHGEAVAVAETVVRWAEEQV